MIPSGTVTRAPALSRSAPLALLVLCGGVLLWHSLQYDFVTDDAYISFVFARNLAEHGALVFNPGMDPVEGYTNFLWTLVLGLLMRVGLEPELTARVLGTAFGLANLVVAWRLVDEIVGEIAGEPDGAPRGGWALVAPALLAFSAGFACWSSGGLETQMFTFWVSLSFYAYVRAEREPRWLPRMGVFLALSAMTRPEGLLVTAIIGGHRLVANLIRERRLVPTRTEIACLCLFLAVWAPWYAWRWWYYGYPFPNTAYVKAGGAPPAGYTATLLSNGLYYVWQWAWQTKTVLAAPVIVAGLVGARPGSRRLYAGSLALALALVYLAYTVSVGGDFMGLHRFVMPVFVIAAVGCALGLRLVIQWLATRVPGVRRPAIAALLAVAVIAGFAVDQVRLTVESLRWGNWKSDHGIDTPAYLHIYTADRAAIGAHMRQCFEPDDFSIVGGAGAQPYEGRMRAIDVFGLVSERIAHEVPPTHPRAGHNKWGPDALLLEHEPEFVFSCYSIHDRPDNARMNCSPGFWTRNGYERVTLHIPGLRQQGQYYTFWKRKDRAFTCPGLVEQPARTPAPRGAR